MDLDASLYIRQFTERVNRHLSHRNITSREAADLVMGDVTNDVLREMERDPSVVPDDCRRSTKKKAPDL